MNNEEVKEMFNSVIGNRIEYIWENYDFSAMSATKQDLQSICEAVCSMYFRMYGNTIDKLKFAEVFEDVFNMNVAALLDYYDNVADNKWKEDHPIQRDKIPNIKSSEIFYILNKD